MGALVGVDVGRRRHRPDRPGFVIPFKWWAVASLVGFGSMEAIGLVHPSDGIPR